MSEFRIYPAIDLRHGQVVRLKQGDPERQTTYATDPASVAEDWLKGGAGWLHVVNLDGAFGESQTPNWQALGKILKLAQTVGAKVQFGGGLRSIESVKEAFHLGVERVVIGTAAIENPDFLTQIIEGWGSQRLAAGIDARDGIVQIKGWQASSGLAATEAVQRFAQSGVTWFVFTDISRDGVGKGLNIDSTAQLAKFRNIRVIASGGVDGIEDISQARSAGCGGVIIGRALYDGLINIKDAMGYEMI